MATRQIHLFEKGSFKSHSGLMLPYKINADALTDEDLETIASCVIAPKFKIRRVIGVPRGGLRLAQILRRYRQKEGVTLIVDDVFTTGASMEEMRRKERPEVQGVVIFARNACPEWIFPIFQQSKWAGP